MRSTPPANAMASSVWSSLYWDFRPRTPGTSYLRRPRPSLNSPQTQLTSTILQRSHSRMIARRLLESYWLTLGASDGTLAAGKPGKASGEDESEEHDGGCEAEADALNE